MSKFDVIVVGAGPAGLAFARALAGTGLSLAVVERQTRESLENAAFDGREIALTHRSVAHLRDLGAWDRIDPAEVAPLREARVFNGRSPLALSFDTAGTDADRLGTLIPNHCIRRALFAATKDQPGFTLVDGATVKAAGTDRKGAWVELSDGSRLEGRLLIAADSRFSAIRDQLGIGARINRLGKSMMVCRVTHEGDHEGVATEWFDHGQTFAMLPLNGHMSSAVLTLPSHEIDRIAALPRDALGQELTRRYHRRLGAMQVVADPQVYPLAVTWSRHFAATRAALIGDAAVGMHPVTAHGFNLGLAGAVRLAALIRQAAARGRDIGSSLLLRRYEAGHRLASRPVYDATAMIVGLYTAEDPAARLARHVTLKAAARLPYIRHGVRQLLLQH
ncbi:hypothetical protein Y88_1260 [Novosphingobium nitrogenifigens DSM 19370]|uniref:FAD-binding domain-containing protein n=1 Tax=Novosphingobium nitrogenifigens DSM 19370 TaxID=983920 RepID=F1Z827_9SPHN|nr:5-demethoxyubiquinol-8 5-hydroxylase UbiM [Novosphingobium nitrogenifigens]EGD59198.1 hypothetical protein Y88_1260 [Novosphingobium nitrogenifigens DSM 19370]